MNRGVTGELERSDRILIHQPDIGNTGIPKCPASEGIVTSLQTSLREHKQIDAGRQVLGNK